MPYSKMTSNLNQSVFAILIGSAFSALILALFSMQALILFIFAIPLGFLIALIVMTECLYAYKDEVTLDQTLNMVPSLLKAILISIPVIFLYSSIVIILESTIGTFREALGPLFSERIQGLPSYLAIPVILFIPNFIMSTTMPFFLYFYGKVHMLIWGRGIKRKKEAEMSEVQKIQQEERIGQLLSNIDKDSIRLQQYILELQVIPQEIQKIQSHEQYKNLHMRMEMMKSYVPSLGTIDAPENKALAKDEGVKDAIEAINMQKNAILEQIKGKMKELKSKKGQYEAPPEEGEEDGERPSLVVDEPESEPEDKSEEEVQPKLPPRELPKISEEQDTQDNVEEIKEIDAEEDAEEEEEN